ncbi:MAG: helix-turn-helix domain-containing protein [Bacteroidota bacterium]
MLKVKQICKQQGITLRELAERMNVSPEAVTRMLSDKGNPTLSSLKSIATALNLEVYELFDDFNSDKVVKGYIETGENSYRINNLNDLKTIYNKLTSKK